MFAAVGYNAQSHMGDGRRAMITRRFLLLFAAEVLVLAVVCILAWRIHIAGFPAGRLAVWALIGYILIRALHVLGEFILSFLWRTPRSEENRLGFVGFVHMILTEIGACLMIILMLRPFGRFFVAWRRPFIIRAGQRPVLLIHGYAANSGVWTPMIQYLLRRGLTNLFTIDLEPRFGDIDDYARQLAARVTRICNTTRADKVILVAHSMGGLVARAYIEQFGGAHRVAKLICIGTPHHGTVMARLAPGVNASQMRIGSAWLGDMNRDENYRNETPYVSIYSCHDNVVFPQNSAEFGKARNLEVVGRGHYTLLMSREVGRLLYREISVA